MKYDTIQKQYIVDVLKNNNKPLTVKMILEFLKKKNIEVGQTTVYRCLNELLKDEKIKKVKDNNEAGYIYLADCHNKHIHMLCEGCGEVSHIDIENIQILGNFDVDLFKSNLLGTCKNCKEGDN